MNTKREGLAQAIFAIFALSAILFLLLITLFLFTFGIPTLFRIGIFDFIAGSVWQPSANVFGIFPMIVGSVLVTVVASILGVPIAILTSVFISNYCPKKIYPIFSSLVKLLAGVPSIIFGFFGIVLLVPIVSFFFSGSGKGLLTAGILLAIMILPTIILVSESQIRAVPESYYEGALALGATKEWAIFTVVLKACRTGLVSAVVLGIGRAIGETMAVVMIAGNQPILPESLISGIRTLTSNIVLEMGYATGVHRSALIATGVILFIFILILNLILIFIKSKSKR